MAHTKGDWEYITWREETGHFGAIQVPVEDLLEDGSVYHYTLRIALIPLCLNENRSEWLDNARLIAAAPDLLNGVIHALKALSPPFVDDHDREVAMKALVKAISKVNDRN